MASTVSGPVESEEELVSLITTQHVDEAEDVDLLKDESYSEVKNSILRERVGKLSDTQNEWSIYRIPSRLLELNNEDAYTPRIVSIGPFHYGQENLQAMEVHKTRYMDSLFHRTRQPAQTFKDCNEAMLTMVDRACSCYSKDLTTIPMCEFSKILLVDSCFLLELFIRWRFPYNSEEISGDPIFGAATICSLQRDLALLENQIPFFVLEHLFKITKGCCRDKKLQEDQISLNQLCASFFYLDKDSSFYKEGTYRHLLDIIHFSYVHRLPLHWKNTKSNESAAPLNCCMQQLNSRTKRKPKKRSWELIHCVTKLRESGIKFVKGTSESLFDIKFSPKGVLEIPKLCIDDTMDSLLRNMIAFEQCCHGTSHHITSYAVLMDCLIDSPSDAEYLQHKRIIENYLGHGEEVSNIFNKISKKVFVEHFYFDALCKQVNEYCDKRWPKKREIFVRDYWISPWKFIGVVSGSVLLLLTAFQTGYTIATFYAHHD